ncbi:MAG: aminotransferase class V-fold PLP-dependent enzyme [Pseudomonadota bacterium]
MSLPALDLDFVRRQFPPLANGWTMLENGGGSYVPQSVIDRVTAYMREVQIQPSWDFGPSADAAGRIASGRRLMAEMINAEPEEVSIGPSTTLNIYLLMQAIRHWFRPGDEVIVTNQDHEANIGAWRRLSEDGVVIREWQIDPVTGELDEAALDRLLGPRTKLVCFTHCSNIVGTIHDAGRIARHVHEAGALVMVDGVACAPHRAIDVKALDVDFYAFSLYKVFGPHQGLLYGKREHLLKARGQNHFFIGETEIPLKLLPGGVNHEFTAGLVGLADYLDALYARHFKVPENSFASRVRRVFELIAAHEENLANRTLDFLRDQRKVRVVGRTRAAGDRAPTISFAVEGMSSRRVAEALNAEKIAIGYGDFYARRCIEALGLMPQDGVVRIGLAHYNTADEIDRALGVLERVIAKG